MKIITIQEQVVSYELAKKLFDAGIDIPTNDFYHADGRLSFKMSFECELAKVSYHAPRASHLMLLLRDKIHSVWYKAGKWYVNKDLIKHGFGEYWSGESLPNVLAEALIELVTDGTIKIEE